MDSSFPLGSAFVETSPVPRGEQFVPPAAAPWMRCQSDFIDAVVAMSGFARKIESGR